MRIAIIIPALKKQAPIAVATNLALEFVKSGNSVTIFYFDKDVEFVLPDNIIVQRISFFEKIKWNDYDIVHSHLLRPDIYAFFHKPLKTSAKLITTVHNYIYPELENYYNTVVSLVVGTLWLLSWLRFDAIAVLSEHAAQYYKKRSFNKKIYRCYNGLDISINYDLISNEAREACVQFNSKYFYTVGVYCNLVKRKRIDILIQHLRRNDNGCLIVIGDGPEKKHLQTLSETLKVSDRVLFLGYQPDAHLFNRYFDLFAIPSEHEGFGLALIEAALHKQKIVCSNIPVFREIFDENSVTFFDFDDSSVDNAIKVALMKEEKGLLAFEIATNNFSNKSMSVSYMQLYERLRFI